MSNGPSLGSRLPGSSDDQFWFASRFLQLSNRTEYIPQIASLTRVEWDRWTIFATVGVEAASHGQPDTADKQTRVPFSFSRYPRLNFLTIRQTCGGGLSAAENSVTFGQPPDITAFNRRGILCGDLNCEPTCGAACVVSGWLRPNTGGATRSSRLRMPPIFWARR